MFVEHLSKHLQIYIIWWAIKKHAIKNIKYPYFVFSSVQPLSHVRLFETPRITALQASLSITNSGSSFRLTSIESVMPSSHLILCHPDSSCPQFLPASESFPMSQLFAWGGQSAGVSVKQQGMYSLRGASAKTGKEFCIRLEYSGYQSKIQISLSVFA